jgi:hypothetical protein
VFLVIFWVFNALMAVWMVAAIGITADGAGPGATEAERAGAAIGSAIGLSMVLSVWLIGAALLGLFVMMTRGRKVISETVGE